MSTRFVACPSCARHVRDGDCTCPFCGANVPRAKPMRSIAQRLSRAAIHAAGAAGVAVAMTGCSSSSSYGAHPCSGDCGQPQEAGAVDASTADAGTADAPLESESDASSDGGTGDAEPDAADGGATPDAPGDAPSDGG